MTLLTRSALFVLLLAVAACGGETAPVDVPKVAETPAAVADPFVSPEAPPAFDGPALEVTMTPVGDTMAFEQTELTAQPGQTVRITFQNTATSAAMIHNVVVLHAGVNADAFGQAAMMAEDTEFIPAQMADQIVAHTPLADPGETVTVEFTAPAAGTYVYLCSYPGHYMLMRGTLTVA